MYRPTEAQLTARRAWVNAVRVYPQSKGALCQFDEHGAVLGYCCLGVATHLYDSGHMNLKPRARTNFEGSRSIGTQLPVDVAEWLGIGHGRENVSADLMPPKFSAAEPEFRLRIVDPRFTPVDVTVPGYRDGPDLRNDAGITREEMAGYLHKWFLAPYEEASDDDAPAG